MPGKLIVIGGGEHARVVIETAILDNNAWEILGFIDPQDDKESEKRFNIIRLGDDSDIPELIKKFPTCKFICGIGDNTQRRKIIDKIDIPNDRWTTIIHPAAEISPNAIIAKGCVVLSRAIIQTGVILNEHVIVNSGAIIEHDVEVGQFSHIAPGVVAGGGVKIGIDAFIGLGSRIRDHITIGKGVTVGTGSVVVTDIIEGETVVGVPARRIEIARNRNRDIHELCIPPDTTLYEAMSMIGRCGAAALITDPEMHLLGLLNDGDIRRAVLNHTDFDTPVDQVMNKNFRFFRQSVPRAAALDQLKALGYRLMPIIDDDGKVVGLHLLDAMIGSLNLPNIAVIMAGGKGTRLKPLTDNLPKPMVRVAGRPILEHIILHLAGSNIREIYIAVNYLSEMIEDYFQDGSTFGVNIHYLREDTPLGTGGALRLLPSKPEVPIIVMNGDLVTQFNVERMLQHHKQGDYQMTIGAHDYRVDIPYGVIEWDAKDKSISNIQEKPEKHFIVNGGIYVINPDLIDFIEPDKNVPITTLVDKCLENNMRIGAHIVEGDWMDVGHHKELAAARGV